MAVAKKKRTVAKKKTTARKPASRAVTAKKKAPAKAAASRSVKKVATVKRSTSAIKDVYNKTQVLTHLAESSELTKKQIAGIFEELNSLIERHIKKNGAGEFTLPGLLKVRVVRKPATKARKGINPFTGEETTFKAKPARNVVKIKPLKALKDMVA